MPDSSDPVSNVAWKEFFVDRSWGIPPGEDHMRPAREHLTADQLRELMDSYLTHCDYTSRTFGNNTISLASCDGCAMISPSHTRPWAGDINFTNVLSGAPALSEWAFIEALKLGQRNGISTPDTLIIGGHEAMVGQAKRIQRIMHDIHNWNIDICPSGALRDKHRYYWFLASRKNSGLHLRDCGHDYYEVCAMRWDWIVGSLSTTQPVSV